MNNKRIIYSILGYLFLGLQLIQAQTTGKNYVHTKTYRKPLQENQLSTATKAEDKIESITYFDGLGRPIQTIAKEQSPNKKDILNHIEYDGFGRQDKDYLPIEIGGTSGFYRGNKAKEIRDFYYNKYPEDFLDPRAPIERNPYSCRRYEASPLNRVTEIGAPGKDWLIDDRFTAHTIKIEWGTNSTDEVAKYKVSLSNQFVPSLIKDSFYAVGELHKTITKDENWQASKGKDHTTEEFKNKQGQVILKRTYNNQKPHDTYYIYDDYGNLTYVLPPKVNHSNVITEEVLNNLCYQYKYDYRNRLIEKRIPGKGKEYIVYNKLDQPVLTQDANQQIKNEWLFTKYDAFGRVAYTGKIQSSLTREQLQAVIVSKNEAGENRFTQFETKNNSPTTIAGTIVYYSNTSAASEVEKVYTINYYDNYNFDIAGGAKPTESIFGQEIIDNVKNLATGSKVRVLGTNDWITTVTYYDEKARPIYGYSKNDYLNTIDIVKTQYDFIGRVLKTRTSHKKGSNPEIVTQDVFVYDHTGRLLTQNQCIGDLNLAENCGELQDLDIEEIINLSVIETVSKDVKASNAINLQPGFEFVAEAGKEFLAQIKPVSDPGELIVSNGYDEIGQLESKKVGNTKEVPLQDINYKYNIRGWLTQINNPGDVLENDLFSFKINYNKPNLTGSTKLYNGNISETHWKTANDNTLRNYSYQYDALNRITSAISNTGNYNLSNVSYDKMGNIHSLNREGLIDKDLEQPFGAIDKLSYRYDMGNKLLNVDDTADKAKGFKDGYTFFDEYFYDANGNMISDLNKGITNIEYNHLNLPTQIRIKGEIINYIYDATGNKIKKHRYQVFSNHAKTTYTNYAGNYVYEGVKTQDFTIGNVFDNENLKFFNHPEGYVEPKNENDYSAGFTYIYQYKDHLGNIRLSYADANRDGVIQTDGENSEIREEKNYYPFGLQHKGYNNVVNGTQNNYMTYNGKELNESLGLNIIEMDMRQYDPAIGRFNGIDPITHYSMGTSVAFDNNPIFWADPSGADATSSIMDLFNNAGSGYTRYENTGNGNFEQTAHASDEDIANGKAILIAFPDQNPKIPSNQGAATWLEKTFGDGNGKVEGAGHAGIVLIDGDTGGTRYFDFGRYRRPDLGGLPEDTGAVRSSKNFSGLAIPDWNFNKTDEQNVSTIVTALHKSPVFKGYGTIMGTLAEGLDFKAMLKYATEMEKKGYHPFGGYSSSTNSSNPSYCAKFARGCAEAGGFDWSWYVLTGKANVEDVNRVNQKGIKTIKD